MLPSIVGIIFLLTSNLYQKGPLNMRKPQRVFFGLFQYKHQGCSGCRLFLVINSVMAIELFICHFSQVHNVTLRIWYWLEINLLLICCFYLVFSQIKKLFWNILKKSVCLVWNENLLGLCFSFSVIEIKEKNQTDQIIWFVGIVDMVFY